MLPAAAVPKSQGYFNILILKSKPFYLIFKVLMVKIKSASDIKKTEQAMYRLLRCVKGLRKRCFGVLGE